MAVKAAAVVARVAVVPAAEKVAAVVVVPAAARVAAVVLPAVRVAVGVKALALQAVGLALLAIRPAEGVETHSSSLQARCIAPNFRSSGRAGCSVPHFLSISARRSPKRYAAE